MKISLAYPKIPSTANCLLKQCIAFEKLDGTNMHFVYQQVPGTTIGHFYYHGTRRNRYSFSAEDRNAFKEKHGELADVFDCHLELFLDMEQFFGKHSEFKHSNKIVLFMEYCGEKSFAGQHDSTDDTKTLYLIDAEVDGEMLPPEKFLTEFAVWKPQMPKVIYKGKYSGRLVEDIRSGKYSVKEGAVIKGIVDSKTYMVKVKTNKYMEKLKESFSDKWLDYWE